MEQNKLPEAFLHDMRQILEDEFDDFLASYDEKPRRGLRLNTLKIRTPEEFERFRDESGFDLAPVPWTENGFFCDESDQPSRHPYYSAGLYYLQEPSAMAPAQILPVEPGDRVLDLCAAPGGKTTELGARLQGKGLLVANEISPARCRALVRNVELFGITNALVTNTDADHLLRAYPSFFDKILVDAPCSGEGMFRKDEEAVRTWSPEKVRECAYVQKEIIALAADMLRPGGYMVYSTCTFSPEEDELTLLHLLRERPDMELIEIPKTGGREGFTPGLSIERLKGLGYLKTEDPEGEDAADGRCLMEMSEDEVRPAVSCDLTYACRLWPHKIEGEGHFVALLKKRGKAAGETEKKKAKGTGKGGKYAGSHSDRGNAGKGDSFGRSSADQRLSETDFRLICDFIHPYLQGTYEIRKENLDVHQGKVYLMPEYLVAAKGITTARAGVYIGELKKNRFEPEQELALVLPQAPGSIEDQAEDYLDLYICLPPSDDRIEQYLHGAVIPVTQTGPNGWRLLCAGRHPVGWGKLVQGQLKNKYPAGWRIPG